MSEFTEANVENVIVACGENTAALAESFNQCFYSKYRVEVGESLPFAADSFPEEFAVPGLAVAFKVGEQSLICLIPESMPLPEWYTTPNDSETSRLQTLAMEWSMNMVPADLEAGEFVTVAVSNLKESLLTAKPVEWAAALELLLFDESAEGEDSDDETAADAESTEGESESAAEESAGDEDAEKDATGEESASDEAASDEAAGDESAEADETAADSDEATDSAETSDEQAETSESAETSDKPAEAGETSAAAVPAAKLLLIWPTTEMPVSTVEKQEEPTAPVTEADTGQPQPAAQQTAAAANAGPQISEHARRLLSFPVTVVVRLAEKKIEMGQLLSISPGALITFNKPCEELLDLYVNNHRYGRGEAVKIGEKFGLKINEVGVVEIREPQIFE